MYVIRPITLNDLDAFEHFAMQTVAGMTSLPKDRQKLKEVIRHSIDSFGKEIAVAGDERYTFIMEEIDSREVVGTCGIYAKTGVNEFLHFYKLETTHPESRFISPLNELSTLRHVFYQSGPSELCGIYLKPEHRKEGMGPLLSLSRLLFVASHPHRFSDTVMARLRGFIKKEDNSSPFWDAVGRKFVDLTFEEVLKLLESSSSFVPDILPKTPIYTSFISKSGMNALGKMHPTTRPASAMLKEQNFKVSDEFDIFDGGPTLRASTKEIKAIKNSKTAKVVISNEIVPSKERMIANVKTDFRACFGEVKLVENGYVAITKETAKALHVKNEDAIRFL